MWLVIKAPALMEPSYETPFPTAVPKANADCEIGKHHASHFLSISGCSQLTHTITWQACECDKVNLDSTMDRKWMLLWWNSNCNRSDKRQIRKTHSRLLGVFSKDKHLFMAWVNFFFFFLTKTRYESFGRWLKHRALFPRTNRMETADGGSGSLQGGSCYLRCGPGAMSTSLYELHEKVQQHRCFWTEKFKAISCPSVRWHGSLWKPVCLSSSSTVLPNMLFTAPRINVNGGINTKISFS